MYIIETDEKDVERLRNDMHHRLSTSSQGFRNTEQAHDKAFEEGYRKGYEDGFIDHAKDTEELGRNSRYGR